MEKVRMVSSELLGEFFALAKRDPRISITHIGIYAALLEVWRERQFEHPICAFSHEVMPTAKISASSTYHKIIRDLSDFGYIRYEPSFKRTKASKIYMVAVGRS